MLVIVCDRELKRANVASQEGRGGLQSFPLSGSDASQSWPLPSSWLLVCQVLEGENRLDVPERTLVLILLLSYDLKLLEKIEEDLMLCDKDGQTKDSITSNFRAQRLHLTTMHCTF